MSTDQEYPPLEFPGWERSRRGEGDLYFCRTIGGRMYCYRVGADRPIVDGNILLDVPDRCFDRPVEVVIREIENLALARAKQCVERVRADLEKIKEELGR